MTIGDIFKGCFAVAGAIGVGKLILDAFFAYGKTVKQTMELKDDAIGTLRGDRNEQVAMRERERAEHKRKMTEVEETYAKAQLDLADIRDEADRTAFYLDYYFSLSHLFGSIVSIESGDCAEETHSIYQALKRAYLSGGNRNTEEEFDASFGAGIREESVPVGYVKQILYFFGAYHLRMHRLAMSLRLVASFPPTVVEELMRDSGRNYRDVVTIWAERYLPEDEREIAISSLMGILEGED